MRRIGMLTSGGDCQALNATMRGVGKVLYNKLDEVEILGFRDGYRGLIQNDYRVMRPSDFSGILTMGGTILGSSRQPFKKMRIIESDGIDKVAAMKKTYRELGLECLVVLGGNGSQKTANLLREEGLNIVSLPKTIDNDIFGTDMTQYILFLFVCQGLFFLLFPGFFYFPEFPEKTAEHFGTLCAEHPRLNFHLMIKAIGLQHIQYRSGTAGFRIHGTDDHFGDPRLNNRSGTHRAGLQRHVHRTVLQAPVPDHFAGLVHRNNFRMGKGIFFQIPFVIAPADNLIFIDNDTADGHFFNGRRLLRLLHGRFHVFFILCHHLSSPPPFVRQ